MQPKLCTDCAHVVGTPERLTCARYEDRVAGGPMDCHDARTLGPCCREGLGFEPKVTA